MDGQNAIFLKTDTLQVSKEKTFNNKVSIKELIFFPTVIKKWEIEQA